MNGAEAAATGGLFSMLPAVAGETTLTFTASDGKATSPEYTLTLTAKASGGTTPAVDWPQLLDFNVTDGYIYDNPKVDSRTIACKIKDISIEDYPELVQKGVRQYAGELHITVSAPVTVENGTPTTTSATAPSRLWISKAGFSGTASNAGEVQTNNLRADQSADDANSYANETYSTIVRILYDSSKLVYYSVHVTIDETPEPTWPQLTGFQLADAPYIYNDYVAKSRNTAWEIKDITVDNYAEIEMREDRGDRPYAGEIQITVKAPVTVENGAATSTPATELPTEIWIKKAPSPEP